MRPHCLRAHRRSWRHEALSIQLVNMQQYALLCLERIGALWRLEALFSSSFVLLKCNSARSLSSRVHRENLKASFPIPSTLQGTTLCLGWFLPLSWGHERTTKPRMTMHIHFVLWECALVVCMCIFLTCKLFLVVHSFSWYIIRDDSLSVIYKFCYIVVLSWSCRYECDSTNKWLCYKFRHCVIICWRHATL